VEIRYTKGHEWIVVEDDEYGTVGVSDRFVLHNGRVVYVEFPEVGAEYEQDEPVGVIETRDGLEVAYHAPVSGEVVEVNEELDDDVNLINVSPEGDGWIFRLRLEFPDELDTLMTPEEYEFYEEEEEAEDDDSYEEDEY
jgi:glycine cleavage system H protein